MSMHDEERLKEKLRAIEALFAGATTEGEREAADRARQRIAARLVERQGERQLEWQFSQDPWSYRLLVSLARRYGIEPYRYRRQRRSTLIIKTSERFMRETFLPEYNEMLRTLHEHLTAVTERVLAEVLNADRSEPTVVDAEPRQLEAVTKTRENE
ncbi:hypothetical protein [Hyalangium sp.]|uniref:hypothetical protein n=1 Tax=Hyalangium sp. TaxID=2028555 RepID=UPI002D462FD1|nr:hypothetical protein [Hyalangium sp.]HYH97864.1 hypothetical protein [Hyalangium sp.]